MAIGTDKMEIITPKNEEHWLELRTQDLTSTDVAALFGISPYLTPYELWHRKKDQTVVIFDENERMFWGTILQDAIAAGIAKQQGWTVKRIADYIRNPNLRLGTSLDFGIENPRIVDFSSNDPLGVGGILEIKNVDYLQFQKEWLLNEKGNYEAPYHIEIQVQHQLLVTGRAFAYIGVLIGGNKLELIKRTPDQKIHEAIIAQAAEFWKSIDENNPPAPNFDTDADFISKLMGYAEPGKVIDVSKDAEILALVSEQQELKAIISDNQKRCDAIKAEVLVRIGDAEKCIAPTFSISAGMIAPTWIEAYERKGYRNFRVNPKKEK